MIPNPNSWLSKLRDMGSSRRKKNPSQYSASSQTKDRHNFISQNNRHFFDPPKESKRKTIYRPSPRTLSSEATTAPSERITSSLVGECKCNNSGDIRKQNLLSSVCKGGLHRIITKREPCDYQSVNTFRGASEGKPSTKKKRLKSNAMSGIRRRLLRFNRRALTSSRNDAVRESFFVVKSSTDPLKDFRESMEEMIVVNNIRRSEDLEDLLFCYLSLNSKKHHGFVVKAFEQVWFKLAALGNDNS